MEKIKNNLGLTLLEMMVAVGISSIVLLGVVNLSQQGAKIQKTVDVTTEVNSLVLRIANILKDHDNCNANFVLNSDPLEWRDTGKIYTEKLTGSAVEIDFNGEKANHDRRGFSVDSMDVINNIPSIVELKFTFSKTSKFKPLGGKKITRSIFIPIKVDGSRMVSCHSQFPAGPSNEAIASAVEKSCGPGLVYNNNPNNPLCVINTGLTSLMNCPDKQYIDKVVLSGAPGSWTYTTTCSEPFTCPAGRIGILVGDQLQCINKCQPDEISVFDRNGFKCIKIQCSQTPGNIEYLAGMDASGNPICKKLVDSTESCGANGWKFISDTSGGSVKAKCCASCPSGANNYCTDQIYNTTTDCQASCYGTSAKILYSYSGWTGCAPNSATGFCQQNRSLRCNKTTRSLPGEGTHYCCSLPTPAQALAQTCSAGNWTVPSCGSGQREPGMESPSCSTSGNCCSPSSLRDPIYCDGRLYQGRKTDTQCSNGGGVVTKYGGNRYCHFPTRTTCPGGWYTRYYKTRRASACGRSHGFCTNNCCSTSYSNNWRTSRHSCTYCSYQDYDTWSTRCYCGGSVKRIYANVRDTLCY